MSSETSRSEFQISDDELTALKEASRAVTYLVAGGTEPASPQENANRAWAILGSRYGFDPMSVRPIPGKDQHFFTAAVSLRKGA